MTTQVIQLELPSALFERARVQALDEARELIAFLLENYGQELEKAQRWQAYEAYYAARAPEEEAEELELLAEFAFADAEATEEIIP
jgi:predicted component of type VI protein secretion system